MFSIYYMVYFITTNKEHSRVILVNPPGWPKLILMDLKKNKSGQNSFQEWEKSKNPLIFWGGVPTEMETVG